MLTRAESKLKHKIAKAFENGELPTEGRIMVAILIVIACIVLYLVMDVLKEHSDKNNKESEYVNHRSRRDPPATGSNANVQATNEPKVKVFTDEEIISSDIFQEEVKKYSKVVMWMTFAGGDEPLLPPIVWYDEKAKCIRLEKKGYEVYIGSYLDYKNGKSWPER